MPVPHTQTIEAHLQLVNLCNSTQSTGEGLEHLASISNVTCNRPQTPERLGSPVSAKHGAGRKGCQNRAVSLMLLLERHFVAQTQKMAYRTGCRRAQGKARRPGAPPSCHGVSATGCCIQPHAAGASCPLLRRAPLYNFLHCICSQGEQPCPPARAHRSSPPLHTTRGPRLRPCCHGPRAATATHTAPRAPTGTGEGARVHMACGRVWVSSGSATVAQRSRAQGPGGRHVGVQGAGGSSCQAQKEHLTDPYLRRNMDPKLMPKEGAAFKPAGPALGPGALRCPLPPRPMPPQTPPAAQPTGAPHPHPPERAQARGGGRAPVRNLGACRQRLLL